MTRWQGLAALAIAALVVISPTGTHIQARERVPAAPGTAAVPVTAFAGGWQTFMNRTEHYTLILQIATPVTTTQIPELQVAGQLLNPDAGNATVGSLQGVIPRGTRTLQFSFSLPAANRDGTGQLILSQDGNSISGSGKAGEVYFTWRGARAQ